MATATYEPIATVTLNNTSSSVTFSSIPATFTDLRIVFVGFAASGTGRVRFNGDSGTNYSSTHFSGNGTSATSSRSSNTNQIWFNGGDGPSTTAPQFVTIDIFNYLEAVNKSALLSTSNDKNGSGEVVGIVGMWRNTSVITSITIDNNNGVNWTGAATLYGIKAA